MFQCLRARHCLLARFPPTSSGPPLQVPKPRGFKTAHAGRAYALGMHEQGQNCSCLVLLYSYVVLPVCAFWSPYGHPHGRANGRPFGRPNGCPNRCPNGRPCGRASGRASGRPFGRPNGRPNSRPSNDYVQHWHLATPVRQVPAHKAPGALQNRGTTESQMSRAVSSDKTLDAVWMLCRIPKESLDAVDTAGGG